MFVLNWTLSRFVCKFTIDGKEVIANAQLLGDTFTCDPVEFTTKSPQSKGQFEILWDNKTKALANPNNVHVVVYNCREQGNTCKTCFTLPAKFNCGWCKTTSKCEIANQCTGDKAGWLNRQQTCPWTTSSTVSTNPIIYTFNQPINDIIETKTHQHFFFILKTRLVSVCESLFLWKKLKKLFVKRWTKCQWRE